MMPFVPLFNCGNYSPELKTQAVREYLTGIGSMSDVCKKYHIHSEKQLYNWLKVYNAHGDFNFTKFSGDGSYMRQGRKTTQEERIRMAEECIGSGKNYGEMALKYQVSYQQVCKWTLRFEEAVARSAYYKWASGRLSRRAAENERLAGKIENIHAESPDKGYRRLNDDLRHDHGIHVNDKRVLRICWSRDIRSTVK